ncbi:hypothetical protein SU60_12250 [Vibrio mytili]|uniref:Uncharacterized protein n=1 Tax=Vibrio mytili TaxID=50718 RepID=A0A0C3HRA3_9VIBR|nr:hypothetical protein SU60_12250 [Vibrio mytili]
MLTSSNRDAKHTRNWTQIGVLLSIFSSVFVKKNDSGWYKLSVHELPPMTDSINQNQSNKKSDR